MQISPKGFSLIELLVVIAIIGILSAVVIVSLSTSRDNANDAAIKSNLSGLASQSELYYVNNGRYASSAISNSCTGGVFSDTTVAAALAAADKENGSGVVTCYANTNAYAVSAARPSTSASTYWCVDSSNKRCGINTNISGTTCGTCVTQN